MRTLDSGSRPQWIDLLITILSFILSLLTGGAGAGVAIQALSSPDRLSAFEAGGSTTWFWILFAAVAVLAVVAWAFRMWQEKREGEDSELLDQVFGFIDWLLDALEKETGRLLRDIPQATVEAAAKRVYSQFIAGTALAIVPEQVFVDAVVAQWRKMAGVQSQVARIASQSGQAGYVPGFKRSDERPAAIDHSSSSA